MSLLSGVLKVSQGPLPVTKGGFEGVQRSS